MAGFDPGFSDEHISHARDAYDLCATLVDSHLEIYDPGRDDLPIAVQQMMGLEAGDSQTETVRYNIAEPPTAGTLPGPYSSVLEKSAVIAFQKIDHEPDSRFQPSRKIELLDPFRAIGGVTLLMLGMEEVDTNHPGMPRATIHGEEVDGWSASRPFIDADLIDNISHMAVTIRRLSEMGKLVPISFNDVQAMYQLQNELGNH